MYATCQVNAMVCFQMLFYALVFPQLRSISAKKKHHKTPVPQIKEESQTFQVESFWHLATPRSPFQIFNGVDCGESSCLGSLLLASSAEGPGVPRSLGPAAWLHVAANHNGNNSEGMGHMHLSALHNRVMNHVFIKTQGYQSSRYICIVRLHPDVFVRTDGAGCNVNAHKDVFQKVP